MPASTSMTLTTANTWQNIDRKEKTEMCKYVSRCQKCPFARRCSFAHSEGELRKIAPLPQNARNYKTQKCKNYHSGNGYCPYGNKCNYIHGETTNYLIALWTCADLDLASDKNYDQCLSRMLPTESPPKKSRLMDIITHY